MRWCVCACACVWCVCVWGVCVVCVCVGRVCVGCVYVVCVCVCVFVCGVCVCVFSLMNYELDSWTGELVGAGTIYGSHTESGTVGD